MTTAATDAPSHATPPTTYIREGEALKDHGLHSEWVITNGLGGFAMGTASGIPTRRYHALLIGAERPPVDRVVALSAVAEPLVLRPGRPGPSGEERVHLGVYHFTERELRAGHHPMLTRFERGPSWAEWTFEHDGAIVRKRLVLTRDRNACELRYEIDAGGDAARIELRPLVGLRDFHGLNAPESETSALPTSAERDDASERGIDDPTVRSVMDGVLVATRKHGVHLTAPDLAFTEEPGWWLGFEYLWEAKRGQDSAEDLYTPGVFARDLPSGRGTATLFASMDAEPATSGDAALEASEARMNGVLGSATALLSGGKPLADADRRDLARLVAAGDDFVVRRSGGDKPGTSIIAGYPWFSDWGRDTMICLPGLLLCTGRFDEALNVLSTFAAHRRRGIIPNRFDDYGGDPHYNTVDASLWFLHACASYVSWTRDREGFAKHLQDACLDVVDAYTRGTDYNIGVDPADNLVSAGDAATQLTWMDARRDGVTFTPRHGKAVEINALWIHGLRALSSVMLDTDALQAAHFSRTAASAAEGFQKHLWDARRETCFDRLEPAADGTWKPSPEIRPNMVFAASLKFGPLDAAQRKAVLSTVRRELLAPEGLRTLAPGDASYRPRFEGPLFDRDAAYHNGTVWPWLKGAYIEGVLRAGAFSPAACAEARALLEPWIGLIDSNTIGSIAEVFDADEPRRADGCMAQAWSVAEPLRLLALVLEAERGIEDL